MFVNWLFIGTASLLDTFITWIHQFLLYMSNPLHMSNYQAIGKS